MKPRFLSVIFLLRACPLFGWKEYVILTRDARPWIGGVRNDGDGFNGAAIN
jgi:hypothetical protein